jgi:hypothetical protein
LEWSGCNIDDLFRRRILRCFRDSAGQSLASQSLASDRTRPIYQGNGAAVERRRPPVKNVTRAVGVAVMATALMVGWPGATRAEGASAILALYANGVLETCVEGMARERDIPWREDTSDPRTRVVLKPVGSADSGVCPDTIPRRLPLPANVAAVEGEGRTLVSEGERMTIRTFIFDAGNIEGNKKAIKKESR